MKDKQARHDIETLTMQLHELVRCYDQLLKVVAGIKSSNVSNIVDIPTPTLPKAPETKRRRNDPPRVGKTARSRSRWTDDEIALLCLLREQGAQWSEIATIFKRTKKACLDQYSKSAKAHVVANVSE